MSAGIMKLVCIIGAIIGIASVIELHNTPGPQLLSSFTAGAYIGVCLVTLTRLILEDRP
jgi:hypothetical protein